MRSGHQSLCRARQDCVRLLTAVALIFASHGARADSPESDLSEESQHLAQDASQYAIPDLADGWLKRAEVTDEHDRFSLKLGLAVLLDYTTFDQDQDSLAQVGLQDDDFEVRSARLTLRGHYELWRRWNYQASYEYKGFENEPGDPDWSSTDLNISTSIGGLGSLKFGRMKEPHSYELAGDSANLPQSERLLSPFYLSRSIGIQLSNVLPGQVGTWSIGVYNDWFIDDEGWSDSGTDIAGRITLVPVWKADGARYLHLGASMRYQGGDNDELRFRGQPASHVTDFYVDTGTIAADHSVHLGLEALWSIDQYSLLAEYIAARVSTHAAPNATLDGWYVTASWVVTGDRRPYDRKVGYARRVMPQGRWGAVELVARVGKVDLDDGPVSGGTMDGVWLGVNWWATRRWKLGVSWGSVDLDRAGSSGNTRMLLGRLQWIH